MKKLVTALSIGLVIVASQQVLAQASVEKGKSVAIEIPVDSATDCNIEVTRGGEKTDVRFDSKSKKGIYEFAGRELGEETIRWEGKMKFRGLKTLGPCGGAGKIAVTTIEPGGANSTATKDDRSAETESAKAADTAPTPQTESTQSKAPVAPENFQIFSRNGSRGYEMLKKLDGSFVLANPDALRGDQKYCPITLSNSYDQEGLAAVLSAMPIELAKIFSNMGAKAELNFPAIECIVSNGNQTMLGNNPPLVVVQKSALRELSALPGFERYSPLSSIDGTALMVTAKRLADEKSKTLAEAATLREQLERLAAEKSKEQIGSITFAYSSAGENLRLCTRKGDESFKLATNGYFATKKLRLSKGYIDNAVEKKSRLNRQSPITKVFETLDDFYLAIQREPGVCEVYVDFPENLKVLLGALKEKPHEINPLVPVPELKNDWAVAQGYSEFAKYEFAKNIGGDARLVEQLASFNVLDIKAFNDAVTRMNKEGYSEERSGRAVISFLSDEKAGREVKKSASAVRNERARLEAIQEKKREEEERARRAEEAKRYPFYAVLSCGFGGSNMSLIACFSGGGRYGVDTEITFTQGNVKKVYKVYEIANNALGREQRDGLRIDLPSRFFLSAQNASDQLTLTLKVYDRATDRLIMQEEAGSRFGLVSARN